MRRAFNPCFISRLLIALLALAVWGKTSRADAPNNLQIYILMEQSNMVGQDVSTLANQINDPRILALASPSLKADFRLPSVWCPAQ